MSNIQQEICAVIPWHMTNRLASRGEPKISQSALATIEQMHEILAARTLLADTGIEEAQAPARKNRRIYDCKHTRQLPGHLVLDEHGQRPKDVEVNEAFDFCGLTWDFYEQLFGWSSVDGRGRLLPSNVHYGVNFVNAAWDGKQMIYGDGDGVIFVRFTKSRDVVGHEITHGVIQYIVKLGYSGQTGALNEHLADAFGSMIRQRSLNETAAQASWLIGHEIFGPGVIARGIRDMANPGTAYDDAILGKDPQPAHMRDYVETNDDNGGVHVNSGILNKAFYISAITLGGYSWQLLGRIWWKAMKERIAADCDFNSFARATVDVAAELGGSGGHVQLSIAQAWALVGINVPVPVSVAVPNVPAAFATPKRHQSNWFRAAF
jgi:Zn-dependent metalloprotease